MREEDAYRLIKTMVDMDLCLQAFASKEMAERAANAFTIVLRSPYVATFTGYKWMVTPKKKAENAYPPRNRTPELLVVVHVL